MKKVKKISKFNYGYGQKEEPTNLSKLKVKNYNELYTYLCDVLENSFLKSFNLKLDASNNKLKIYIK